MIVYVVVTVYAGCVSKVKGFIDSGEAETHLATEWQELFIEPGLELESENNIQLHELDIETYPTTVAIRRKMI